MYVLLQCVCGKYFYNFIVFEIMIVFDYMCDPIGSVTGFGDHATGLGSG